MSRVVIIAAMEREVKPLVREWRRSSTSDGARNFQTFEKEERVVVISGIGSKHAETAARAAVAQYRPEQLVSVGLAGALIRSLKAGSVFTPNVVVDATDGTEYRSTPAYAKAAHAGGPGAAEIGGAVGGGVLVSADEIAGIEAKQKLVERFHALVVDMEAAGVAKAAQEAQVAFRCVKAISDEADFVMQPLAKFVDVTGNFQSGRFAGWAAMRPWQWLRVAKLSRNAAKATRALCEWLEKNLAESSVPAEVVTLKRAELRDVVPGREGVSALKSGQIE